MDSMENLIRCIAIDDEPLALEVIRKFCDRIGGIELTVFSDPAAGLAAIREEKPAIVFLDIEMENINGLAIASQIPQECCFIFTTAYLDYAMKGFELDAVDYLHKPFAFDRFRTAFNKALRRLGEQSHRQAEQRRILVKQEYNTVSIPLDDIIYIEAMEGYVKIFRENEVCTVSRVILKNIGSQLPEPEFLRIHRSFIVARSKISSFNKKEVILRDGRRPPIGRLYSQEVTGKLGGV